MSANDPLLERVTEVLKTIRDPEIPVSIHELGLVYAVEVEGGSKVRIVMTLTSPSCPVAQALPAEVRERVAALGDVDSVEVELTWDPPWSPDRMSEAARLELDMLGSSLPTPGDVRRRGRALPRVSACTSPRISPPPSSAVDRQG